MDETNAVEVVAISRHLAMFDTLWSPRIVGQVNDSDIRLAKVQGEHVWHSHADTDEMFLVIEGHLTIGLRGDQGERTVELATGELFVVAAGVEHRPFAAERTSILMVERAGTLTTGSYSGVVPAGIESTTGHRVDRGPSSARSSR